MKLIRYFLPVLAIVGICSVAPAFAHDPGDFSRFDDDLSERDFEALKDFINTKRTIPVEEKDCNLTISGDVRSQWRHMTEKRFGHSIRGNKHRRDDHDYPIPHNDFDIEFNLRFDYVCDRAWAVAHLQFDNTAGVSDNDQLCEIDPEGFHGSGYCDDICLKQAYMGYNVCCCGDTRFDIEVGRRHLYNVFDSKVQFLSRFDGILVKYRSHTVCIGDWYINAAGFIVDEKTNHYAWIVEGGLLNIADCGLDLKYSFIDWEKRGRNRCWVDGHFQRDPVGFRFRNSQFTFAYHFLPDLVWCGPAKAYGAVVYNHAARGREITHGDKEPWAFYLGFTIGQVVYEGDWAFDARYEYVEAQSIPDRDVSGIGRGNVLDESFTVAGRGNTNYQGFVLEGLYAITNNLTLDAQLEYSRELEDYIGDDKHRYSRFQLQAIYAF